MASTPATVQVVQEEQLLQVGTLHTLLHRTAQFYTPRPTLETTNPDSSEVPPFMTSEVKKPLREMKNKVPGIDNLTSDIVSLGGEESMKLITTFLIRS